MPAATRVYDCDHLSCLTINLRLSITTYPIPIHYMYVLHTGLRSVPHDRSVDDSAQSHIRQLYLLQRLEEGAARSSIVLCEIF